MNDNICTYCGQTGHRASACKRRVIAALALCTALAGAQPASAAILGIAPSSLGGTIEVHDDRGICVDAHRARWVSLDGKKRVEGCWQRAPGSDDLINFVFLDVSIAQLPLTAFTKPRTL